MTPEGFEGREQAEIFEQDLSWNSDIENGDRAATMTNEELLRLGWPEDQAYKFSLAVQEAVLNAIVHGNLEINKKDGEEDYEGRIREAQALNKEKQVKIYLRFTKDEATAQIKDEGSYIPAGIEDPTQGDRLLKSSGRGMLLIFNGADNVAFSAGEIVIQKQRKDNEDAIA